MGVVDDWERVAARIRGMRAAIETLERNKVHGPLIERSYFNPVTIDLIGEIKRYFETYRQQLGHPASAALARGLEHLDRLAPSAHQNSQDGVALVLIAQMLALESEVTFHIHDFDERVAPIAERAFLHLQRTLVVDEDVRGKWGNALNAGETSCEGLGAAHLLAHGIYAFKTDAKGERSDLILGEPVLDIPALHRATIGLVLTEWKVAKRPDQVDKKFLDARNQSRRYAVGHLAGFELRRYRYLVVVTEDHCAVPPDLLEGDVTYRHINIAVDASRPSRAKQ